MKVDLANYEATVQPGQTGVLKIIANIKASISSEEAASKRNDERIEEITKQINELEKEIKIHNEKAQRCRILASPLLEQAKKCAAEAALSEENSQQLLSLMSHSVDNSPLTKHQVELQSDLKKREILLAKLNLLQGKISKEDAEQSLVDQGHQPDSFDFSIYDRKKALEAEIQQKVEKRESMLADVAKFSEEVKKNRERKTRYLSYLSKKFDPVLEEKCKRRWQWIVRIALHNNLASITPGFNERLPVVVQLVNYSSPQGEFVTIRCQAADNVINLLDKLRHTNLKAKNMFELVEKLQAEIMMFKESFVKKRLLASKVIGLTNQNIKKFQDQSSILTEAVKKLDVEIKAHQRELGLTLLTYEELVKELDKAIKNHQDAIIRLQALE
jgi:hypothetical protein